MRRRIGWILTGVPVALAVLAAGTAAAIPGVRHVVSGIWNAPDRLPALAGASNVHFEKGAEDFARAVARLLPAAMARVEAAQGRPFAHPVTIGTYATPAAFAAANGLGSTGPVGVTFLGRVNLAPTLNGQQAWRLPAILTHELSHAHIQGWIPGIAYVRVPNWFKEGLAVMVSGGGGAEFVSEAEARAAILRGEHIAIEEAGEVGELRYAHAPATGTASHKIVLAYRQAGMFVAYLARSDAPAFAATMRAILDKQPFGEAIRAGYHRDVQSLWQQFTAELAAQK